MVLIARPDTLAPLGACLALRDADLLRTVQWGAERIHQGGRGAATLYCKRPSSLPPRALQLIHSHSHKERQTGLVAGVGGNTLPIPYPGKRKDKVRDFCQSHPSGRRMAGCGSLVGPEGRQPCKAPGSECWPAVHIPIPPHNSREGVY